MGELAESGSLQTLPTLSASLGLNRSGSGPGAPLEVRCPLPSVPRCPRGLEVVQSLSEASALIEATLLTSPVSRQTHVTSEDRLCLQRWARNPLRVGFGEAISAKNIFHRDEILQCGVLLPHLLIKSVCISSSVR